MKKTFLITLIVSILVSCGPHRMGCGPGKGKRCVEITKKDINTVVRNS